MIIHNEGLPCGAVHMQWRLFKLQSFIHNNVVYHHLLIIFVIIIIIVIITASQS